MLPKDAERRQRNEEPDWLPGDPRPGGSVRPDPPDNSDRVCIPGRKNRMIALLINLLIILLIVGVVWWVITLIPLPPPFPLVAQVILVVLLLIMLIDLLSSVAGVGWHPLWR
jgi:hypothetical protein